MLPGTLQTRHTLWTPDVTTTIHEALGAGSGRTSCSAERSSWGLDVVLAADQDDWHAHVQPAQLRYPVRAHALQRLRLACHSARTHCYSAQLRSHVHSQHISSHVPVSKARTMTSACRHAASSAGRSSGRDRVSVIKDGHALGRAVSAEPRWGQHGRWMIRETSQSQLP